jgi:cytochrome c5
MNRLDFSLLVLVSAIFFVSGIQMARADTFVSGTVITSDGMVVASGAVALERGELHNNVFETGGVIGPDGRFKIPLPAGGPWGLHVYSEGYLYFPLQITIKENQDNEVPVVLPLDGNPKDDPILSNIRFEAKGSGRFRVRMTIKDSNHNLGPQMLAVDGRNTKSYRLVPIKGDLSNKKADFPEGEYVSAVIRGDLKTLDKSQWFFAAADHQCSNGAIYNGLNKSVYRPPKPNPEPLRCEIPGIWKSNFDKTYRFIPAGPDRFSGEQFEGSLIIKEMVKKGPLFHLSIVFDNEEGQADLALLCLDQAIELRGPFAFPASGKKGVWIFTKLKNQKVAPSGKTLFNNNCAVCHFTNSGAKKVGPGLLGLFKRDTLSSGKPLSEPAVINQIKKGGGGMPPFGHLEEAELQALVGYLKSL